MTRKTIRITRLQDGSVICAEIGPREPFHKETIAADELPAHLLNSGVPEPEIEGVLAVFRQSGWAVTSFLPDNQAALTNVDRALRAERKKLRLKLLARVKSAEKAYLTAAAEFKSLGSEHADLTDSSGVLVALRSARKQLVALDRYFAAIQVYTSFNESRGESVMSAANRG